MGWRLLLQQQQQREREKRGDDDGGKVKGTAERAGGLCQVVLLWVF